MNKLSLVLIVTALLAGCAMRGGPSLSENHRHVVAKDFVNALEMLDGAEPRSTTIQTEPTDSRFGKELIDEMRSRGYGIQLVKKGQYKGPMFVSYTAERFEDNEAESVAYRVRVGRTELIREYEIRGDQIFPITALSVVGIDASNRPLDNSIFRKRDTLLNDLGTVPYSMSSSNEEWKAIKSKASILTPEQGDAEQIDRPAPVIRVIPEIGVPEPLRAERPFSSPPKNKRNIVDLGESNFAEVLRQHTLYREATLVFPNDSLVFGRENKKLLREFIKGFDNNVDIVSVIGCSHGKTKIKNGNEYLANGRANRVKEALILAQIPADRIYDEGCWADTPKQPLPSRGVMVSLHRKNA